MKGGPGTRRQAKKRWKSDRILLPGQEDITITITIQRLSQRPSGFPGRPGALEGPLGDEGQLEMIGDFAHHSILGKERDNFP